MAVPGLFGGGALTPDFRPKPIITAHKRSLGQGNTFAPVCHSVHRGFCLSACWDSRLPGSRHSPRSRQPPPGANTPRTVHAERYGQQAGGTYPTGMHTCFGKIIAKNPDENERNLTVEVRS